MTNGHARKKGASATLETSAMERRVLIFAPTGKDAQFTLNFLAQHNLAAQAFRSVPELRDEVPHGCGMIILAEEALAESSILVLLQVLQEQPPWSDIPILLITSGGEVSQTRLRRLNIFGPGGNVSVLERPFRPATLISAVEVALRSRQRQYEARDRIEELREARDEAQAASRAKDDFLAALSHELRTPLNPVLLVSSDAATNRELPPGVRASFDMIRRNVELEARLIDDLLDLTRVTAGKLIFERRPVNAHGVLKNAIALLQSEIDQKGVVLKQNLGAFQTILFGDAVRLQQVFWNVLKNAVKFTPPGGTITVQTISTSKEFSASISDTGIGMTETELERAFEAFVQGDHVNEARSFGGLGLGLAISKKMTELHDGLIEARSAGRGRGSTFLIKFPLAGLHEQAGKGDRSVSPAKAATRSGVRILLVEDHEPTRTSLAGLLARRRHHVKMAISVREALALAEKNDFDVVISDIGLPDGNGYDLFKKLHKQSPVKGIALTGYGMDDDIARSRDAGFTTHLTKPVHIESLDNALNSALSATS